MKFGKQLGICLLAIGAQVSLASPITFDFSENRYWTSGSHSYLGSDGYSEVEVSAWSEYGTPYLSSYEGAGLAIYTCTEYSYDGCYGDRTHQIDGSGPNEAAVLDFGQQVNLVSATFSYIGDDDDFTLFADGDLVFDDVYPGGWFSTVNFGDDVFGEEFSFLADHWTDDFKLYSVTAEYISNVPEPASLSLLGLGLAALGSMRRKKKR